MIECTVYPDTGFVRVAGTMPDGAVHVERRVEGRAPFNLRGGDFINSRDFILLEDTEAPVAVPLVYVAEVAPTNRLVLENHVLTPHLQRGLQTWQAGTSRSISVGQDEGVGRLFAHATANATNQGLGGTYRSIASVGLDEILPNTTYLVTGRVRFNSAEVFRWSNVKSSRWRAIRDAGKTWRAVQGSAVLANPAENYINLSADIVFGSTVYIPETQALGISISGTSKWQWFSFYFTTPDAIPPNPRLRLWHGNTTREWRTDWDFKDVAVFENGVAIQSEFIEYFDGDSDAPPNTERMYDAASDNASVRDHWIDMTHDAFTSWKGTPGASISRLWGPSKVYVAAYTIIGPPVQFPGEPMLISDPVDSRLGIWVGLIPFDDLVHPAYKTDTHVINRRAKISQSQVRGLEESVLNFVTFTPRDRALLTTVFASGRILLIRNPEPRYPENNWYVSFGDLKESRPQGDQRKALREWSVDYIREDRPGGLINVSSGTSWRKWKDARVTWRELRTRRDNWIDILLSGPDKEP